MFEPIGSLVGGGVRVERLRVGVDHDELDPIGGESLIMVFTALPPDPPTPMTLMRAS